MIRTASAAQVSESCCQPSFHIPNILDIWNNV
jgi:hypothetical protein